MIFMCSGHFSSILFISRGSILSMQVSNSDVHSCALQIKIQFSQQVMKSVVWAPLPPSCSDSRRWQARICAIMLLADELCFHAYLRPAGLPPFGSSFACRQVPSPTSQIATYSLVDRGEESGRAIHLPGVYCTLPAVRRTPKDAEEHTQRTKRTQRRQMMRTRCLYRRVVHSVGVFQASNHSSPICPLHSNPQKQQETAL